MHLPRHTESRRPDGRVMLDAKCSDPSCGFRTWATNLDSAVAHAEIEAEFVKHRAELGEPAQAPARTAAPIPWGRIMAVAMLVFVGLMGVSLLAAFFSDNGGGSSASGDTGLTGESDREADAPAERTPGSIDPEVADNGPRQYTAESFTSSQRNMFVYSLRELDPTFEDDTDASLIALGAEVCESLSNGNSRESIIEVVSYLSGWAGMTSARLVAGADSYLC